MSHGRFDYSPIVDRPPLRWPNGARVALWVIPNIEHFLFDRPSTSISDATYALKPDVLNYSWRDYGVRVGIWRMMDVMTRHGIRGTVALNADVCAEYPRIIDEGKKLGWEWMGHGTTNSILLSRLAEAEERALIREAVTTIGKAVGKSPRGWRVGTHPRHPGRERHRVRRQLGQRRPALSDASKEGPDVLDALFIGDQ
jgi:peptidoglycan/xylan/chitin deacetylase (PgdA/CDA1 family)